MKSLFLSPTTLLLCMLVSIVMLRSDNRRAAQAPAVRTPAAAHVARLDAQRVANAAGTPRLRPARTGGTVAPPTATGSQTDPFAPVYIVTSRDTWQGIRGLARDAVARRDSTGMPLVIAETRADRLGEIGRYVHAGERRCGGYSAFPSRAQAEDFVRALPQGLDTLMDERGVRLSGGERQRIGLARVLLAETPVLVLDEATAFADSRTEHRFYQALRAMWPDKTLLVIAHRLSSLCDAEQIVWLEHGVIQACGTHPQLLASNSAYATQWRHQFHSEDWAIRERGTLHAGLD